jgi:hypothetical protein
MNLSPPPVVKFPRTPHLAGSQLQPGDEDLPRVRLEAAPGARLVVTEKVDGTNVGLRFDEAGRPWLQSRGHLLGNDPQFDRLKQSVHANAPALFARLGTRWLVYGEWLYARHTVFYDALPAYLLVFDALELDSGTFLDTPGREALLAGLPLVGAPVLWSGPSQEAGELLRHLGPSRFRTRAWRAQLEAAARRAGLEVARTLAQSDTSDEMEGLYFRLEAAGAVRARFKFVRGGFRQALADSASHWASRPLIPNQLGAAP